MREVLEFLCLALFEDCFVDFQRTFVRAGAGEAGSEC
jgi:hypothetical protein